MKSIAFFNNKGGVGKTTLLLNLAAYLSIYMNKKVLVIDADPQCNATQAAFSDADIDRIYSSDKSFTIYSIINPLSIGKGYSDALRIYKRDEFKFDILVGDPRLALKEDLLAKDWASAISGDVRGLRTSFVFSQLLSRCGAYDFVLFDMGPSLGSINRACLLSCDFFLSPMSIDIFSLRAIENIRISIEFWKRNLSIGVDNTEDKSELPSGVTGDFRIKFAGYVTQQYIAKKSEANGSMETRAVKAYDRIMQKIPKVILENFINKLQVDFDGVNYNLGSIPNLHSLVPMAQFARKPIFELKAKDGVVGAHFEKVNDSRKLFEKIAVRLLENLEAFE